MLNRYPASMKLFLLGLFVLLAACAPSLNHQVTQQGKSVVLVGTQSVPDYDDNFFNESPSGYYGLSVMVVGGDQKQSRPRASQRQDIDVNRTWSVIAVDPGLYKFSGVRERGWENLFIRDIISKTTGFSGSSSVPPFEVRENEVLYIGTFVTKITSKKGLFGSRRLVDATKSYEMQSEDAREAIMRFKIQHGSFRELDIFAGNADGIRLLTQPWAERPED